MATVTCHTESCGNADVPIDVDMFWTDEEGTEHPVGGVSCGACGQPITDVTDDTPEPEPEPEPPVIDNTLPDPQ